ncbi:uncharacterized protein LOC130783142 [Actinidia eriantha]|uniref:uncharacterized protein LOC130783142 n=1 Tax=Actinidia eriantha TaxID=165200 RepID=UPI002583620C|nr:uncharacterized protein LOC130783142 [Actinidia eriantha]
MSVIWRESSGDPLHNSDEAGASKPQTMRPYSSSSVWEIEEENSGELFEIDNAGRCDMPSIKEELDGSVFSFDFHNRDDVVYVAVGKNDSSMDALLWTLNHALSTDRTLVFLIHVFPELRFIPTPLGKLPISQVNPEQKEMYMIQERSKRREFLQKFLDVCSASKVEVDTVLIESDMEAKALMDLIPILNIRKLVLGTTKSSLRKWKSRRGSGIADRVLDNAPEFCEVKIICEGQEVVVDSISESPSPSPSPRANVKVDVHSPTPTPTRRARPAEENQSNDTFGCPCFKPKVMA